MAHPLSFVPETFHAGQPKGITSVCSAHPVVIEAALRHGLAHGGPVLIEATCNQVNQDGGYTGMTPADFHDFVAKIAGKVSFPMDGVVLGGDHLGPNPWKNLPADQAMEKAKVMIAAFAAAGFTKLHLDTSMGCAGEPVALPDANTAERAAILAEVAEAHKAGNFDPVYIVGTEVPVPGGALEELTADHLQVTTPAAVADTYAVHETAFLARGLGDAFSRVIGLVVQPGVEFGHTDVIHFDAAKAANLTACLNDKPNLVFEAHSTDYQTNAGLAGLVQGGFSILKVGPWLTFALREALYGLDNIADVLEGKLPSGQLMGQMEAVMQAKPANWSKYYSGDKTELWLQRHFSYSDRIRYYWPDAGAIAAVEALRARLNGKAIPEPVLSQFLPAELVAIATDTSFDALLIASVECVLNRYTAAATGTVSNT
jgi:D-tagatose 6-phosphate 4-epimerase